MKDAGIWARAWSLMRPDERRRARRVLVIVVLTAFLAAAMVASIMPFLIILADPASVANNPALAALHDWMGFGSTYSFLIALGIGALAVNLLASAAQVARSYAIFVFSARQAESLSTRLLATYLRQPYSFFLDRHSGDLGTRVLAVSQQVVDAFYRPAAEIVAVLCSALAVLAFVFWVAPLVSVICILVLGVIYGATYFLIRQRIAALGELQLSASQARHRVTVEALGGIKALKIRSREQAYIDRFRKPARDLARVQIAAGTTSEVPGYVLQALAFGGIIALGIALLEAEDAESAAGFNAVLPILGVFAFAGQRLIPELQRIYASFTQMRFGHVAVDAIYEDLIHEREASAEVGLEQAIGLSERLEIEAVSYRYPNSEVLRLDDLSLGIDAGERIGVVGTTGSGKSTLADLVLGLITPETGRLVADGVPITQDNLRAWRRSLGYVPQDIFLIDGSIRDNIALGDSPSDVDEDRLRAACRVARLDAFVEHELPEGYDTLVGERGVRLSGGQRQRIGIARAMYDQPDLLVFDEATSALDMITEKEIIASIDDLPGDKTILIIAHRLATVRACDRIVVMDHGRIAECGTWDELVRNGQLFQRLALAGTEDAPPAEEPV